MASPQRILIVEDEPLIAMMLEDFLEMLDRELAGSADTVAAALDLIAAGGIDAAILDVNLRAGEQSWPIADKLAELGIPFVLATGGSGDSVAEQHRDRPVLGKPFTMDAVEKALDALG
ncbi:response regulator [Sphingomonas sp. G-3-2-10]|uniref:response regulator n=1 Tax=Sphingomonas sp. G-3-2-10 TaxID=2728838 RepID=UPI001469D9D1|nr:response regulator [Sphingomonas sp. G-3-2-10]NML05334.1 response regulator [Sphingomonas sp. G-3-2-10]